MESRCSSASGNFSSSHPRKPPPVAAKPTAPKPEKKTIVSISNRRSEARKNTHDDKNGAGLPNQQHARTHARTPHRTMTRNTSSERASDRRYQHQQNTDARPQERARERDQAQRNRSTKRGDRSRIHRFPREEERLLIGGSKRTKIQRRGRDGRREREGEGEISSPLALAQAVAFHATEGDFTYTTRASPPTPTTPHASLGSSRLGSARTSNGFGSGSARARPDKPPARAFREGFNLTTLGSLLLVTTESNAAVHEQNLKKQEGFVGG